MTKPTGRSKTNSKAKRTARRKTANVKLRNKLDRVFSWYVRLKDTDDAGNVSCITCGKVQHWLHVDAGHLISRKYMATRWLPVNVKPQCVLQYAERRRTVAVQQSPCYCTGQAYARQYTKEQQRKTTK